ncbi:MAG: tetratricopeptide repeat protein [bacterium]|nr:tetratricopeptide repeat protein [bacterium]
MKNSNFKNKLSTKWFVFILLSFIGLSLYINSLANPFFWDDNEFFANNSFVQNFEIKKFFTENATAGGGIIDNYWRPLLLISFALDYKIWGLLPFGFHLTNIFLHIASAFFLFLILQKLFKNYYISLGSSLIFLIHPLQTEAVTYTNSRGDSLYTFWFLLSIILYLKFRSNSKFKFYLLAIFSFLLSLLSKELAVVLPAIILLIETTFLGAEESFLRKTLNSFKKTYLFWLLGAIYVASRLTFLNFKESVNLLSGENTLFATNILVRLMTFFKIVLNYFGLIFAPFNLHMERLIDPVTTVLDVRFISGFLLVLFWLAISYQLKAKSLVFGFFWFFINLAPTSNIVPINGMLYEHWLYLAQIGIWIPLLSLLSQLHNKIIIRNILIITGSIYLIFLSYLTILRNKDWSDPISFYKKTLSYGPSLKIYNNLGMELANKGKLEEAVENYKKALEIDSSIFILNYNLGNTLRDLGKNEEAKEQYKLSIEKNPKFVSAYSNLLNILNQEKKYNEMREILTKLSSIYPEDKAVKEIINSLPK